MTNIPLKADLQVASCYLHGSLKVLICLFLPWIPLGANLKITLEWFHSRSMLINIKSFYMLINIKSFSQKRICIGGDVGYTQIYILQFFEKANFFCLYFFS